jgi:hypothetical protein
MQFGAGALCPRLVLLVASALLLPTLVGGEREVPEFDAYRMVEYDVRGQRFGSRQGKVQHGVVAATASNYKKKIVVVGFEQASIELVDELLQKEKAVGGLLMVLPSPEAITSLSAAAADRFRAVEHFLMQRQVAVPIYFAFDGPETQRLVEKMESTGAGELQVVAHGTSAGAKKTAVQAANMHGWLAGKASEGESLASLPVIAVVASHDSLAVAPDLAVGADANGSGVIAILQLVRMFSKLYSFGRQQGRYNLMFVLTGAGKLDYAGTRYWLEQTDSRILDRIEFALCLDSIGKGDGLFMHTSKQPSKDKVPAVARLFGTLQAAAQEMSLPLEIVRKKINVSEAVAWEHEQFARKDILAVTLSGHATSHPALRASVLDRAIDSEVLARNIRFVANAIAKVVYGPHAPADMFDAAMGPQPTFIAAWAKQVGREPRMSALLSKSALSFLNKAEAILREAAHDFALQPFSLAPDRTFVQHEYRVKMSVYDVRPLSFDLITSAVVVGYLLALMVGLLGVGDALQAISQLLKGKGNKKLKR